ncbi:MAG TPA: glycosyl hydrolase [Micromonosporaceae bacterium]|nr:glycosyl hydrolase [Micromonosporaceae bacterium]
MIRHTLPARWLGAITAATIGVAGAALAISLAAPASAATDLAIGKTASADSTEPGRPPAHANDANAGTRWCAADGNTGHWWQVDLAYRSELTGTQVVWEFARRYQYRIAVSDNGTTWTTVVDRTANTTTAQTASDAFTATARYVRITITGLAPGTWASMFSFSVFGTPPTGPFPEARAYKGVGNAPCDDLKNKLNVSWYYNWMIRPDDGCDAPGFVPTISGKAERNPTQVANAIGQIGRAGYTTVLGFNEPNKSEQSNLTVAQAVALWPTLTANPDIRVGSPATSSDGQKWFNDFMAQANSRNLRVDFIALHWYGWNPRSCDDTDTLESYIDWAESIPGDRPIWITEFGCMHLSNSDPATVQRFYTAALAMFAKHPRIERHAWYPWMPNHHLVLNGALTPMGTTLASAQAYR